MMKKRIIDLFFLVFFCLLRFNFLFPSKKPMSSLVSAFKHSKREFFKKDSVLSKMSMSDIPEKLENNKDIITYLKLILEKCAKKEEKKEIELNQQLIHFLLFFCSFVDTLSVESDKQLIAELGIFVEECKKSHGFIELLFKEKVITIIEILEKIPQLKQGIDAVLKGGIGGLIEAPDLIRFVHEKFKESKIVLFPFYKEIIRTMIERIYAEKIFSVWEDMLLGDGSKWPKQVAKTATGLVKIGFMLPIVNKSKLKVYENYGKELDELRKKNLFEYENDIQEIKNKFPQDLLIYLEELKDIFDSLLDCHKDEESQWGEIILNTIGKMSENYQYKKDLKNVITKFYESEEKIKSLLEESQVLQETNPEVVFTENNHEEGRQIENLTQASNNFRDTVKPSELNYSEGDLEEDNSEIILKLVEEKKINMNRILSLEEELIKINEKKEILKKEYDDLISKQNNFASFLDSESKLLPKKKLDFILNKSVGLGSLIGLLGSFSLVRILKKNRLKKMLPLVFLSGLGIGGLFGALKEYYKLSGFNIFKNEYEKQLSKKYVDG